MLYSSEFSHTGLAILYYYLIAVGLSTAMVIAGTVALIIQKRTRKTLENGNEELQPNDERLNPDENAYDEI